MFMNRLGFDYVHANFSIQSVGQLHSSLFFKMVTVKKQKKSKFKKIRMG